MASFVRVLEYFIRCCGVLEARLSITTEGNALFINVVFLGIIHFCSLISPVHLMSRKTICQKGSFVQYSSEAVLGRAVSR